MAAIVEENNVGSSIKENTKPIDLEQSSTRTNEQECIDALTPQEQKSILHRLDQRLVSTLGLLYAISL